MYESLLKYSPASLSCCAVLAWAGSARAGEPSCELECLRGYACQVLTVCNDGPVSEPTPCLPTPTCVSLPCSSDADCAERMTCHDTNEDTPSLCLPEWHGGCSSDADCGAGFTCAPWTPCLDPAEPDCVPEGESVCFIHTQTCQADADCLPDWTCQNNPLNSYWAHSGSGEMGCGIVEPALICMPPHARQFGLGAGYLDWQTGVEWSSRDVPVAECPAPRSAVVSHTTSGPGIQDASGTKAPTSLGSTGGGAAAQNGAPGASGSAVPAPPSVTGNASCSFGSAAPSSERGASAFGLLSVLGLAGMAAARRRALAR